MVLGHQRNLHPWRKPPEAILVYPHCTLMTQQSMYLGTKEMLCLVQACALGSEDNPNVPSFCEDIEVPHSTLASPCRGKSVFSIR